MEISDLEAKTKALLFRLVRVCRPAAGCAHRKSPIFRGEKITPPLETVVILDEAPKRHIVGHISFFVRLIPPLHPSASDPFFQGQLPRGGIFFYGRLKFDFQPQIPARASRRLEAAVGARG